MYYNDASPTSRVKKVAHVFAENNALLVKEHKHHLQNEFVLSSVAVFIAFAMSCGAAYSALKTGKRANEEVAKLYPCSECLTYWLPFILLGLDAFIFTIFCFCILLSLCRLLFCKQNRPKLDIEYVLIEDDPVSLTSKYCDETSKFRLSNQSPREMLFWWQFFAYSMFFPLCLFVNHLHYISIAFVNDLRHATTTAIIYGVGFIFLYAIMKGLPHILSSQPMACCRCCLTSPVFGKKRGYLFVKIFLVFIFLAYILIAVSLHFFIPYDSGFEDVVSNIVTISNTAVVFFTAVITYFVIKQPSTSSHEKKSASKEERQLTIKDYGWNDENFKVTRSVFMKEKVASLQRDEMDWIDVNCNFLNFEFVNIK